MRSYAALRPLLLFLKVYLRQRGLQDTFTGGCGSFLLSCLVVAFLKQHPSARSASVRRETTLGHLLLDLLVLYSMELDVDRIGVAPARREVFFVRKAYAQLLESIRLG